MLIGIESMVAGAREGCQGGLGKVAGLVNLGKTMTVLANFAVGWIWERKGAAHSLANSTATWLSRGKGVDGSSTGSGGMHCGGYKRRPGTGGYKRRRRWKEWREMRRRRRPGATMF